MNNYMEAYDVPLPSDIDWMLSKSKDIEKAMLRDAPMDVACHNDYLSENFMDDGEKIWIIDWEYGGRGDPYFDLGDFAVEHPFHREQEELIIREYCGTMKQNRLSRMLLHKIVSDLWWGLWAMIQYKVSKIPFDFYTYAQNRFERLRRNVRDRDFHTWLSQL
jgi:thiamine kinase-like enzyme